MPDRHRGEAHAIENIGNRLNWLRAGVLGANDGIVSTAGLVVGVAGASTDRTALHIVGFYVERGLDRDLAQEVARQLTANDALSAHAEVELGIDPDELTRPWTASSVVDDLVCAGSCLPTLGDCAA